MNAAARGTRRPHAKRVYPKARRRAGPPPPRTGCALLAVTMTALLTGYGMWAFAVISGQLVALALAAVIT